MAVTEPRSEAEVRGALREERQRLAESLDELRQGLGDSAAVRARVRRVALLGAGGTLVLGAAAGGVVAATVRRLRGR